MFKFRSINQSIPDFQYGPLNLTVHPAQLINIFSPNFLFGLPPLSEKNYFSNSCDSCIFISSQSKHLIVVEDGPFHD